MRLCQAITVPLLISCVALVACSKRASTSDGFTASGTKPASVGSGRHPAEGGTGGRPFMQAAAGDGRGGGAGSRVDGTGVTGPGGATSAGTTSGGTTYRSSTAGDGDGTSQHGARGDAPGSAAMGAGATVYGKGSGAADGAGGAGADGNAVSGGGNTVSGAGNAASGAASAVDSGASGVGGASLSAAGAQAGLNGDTGSDASGTGSAGATSGEATVDGTGTAAGEHAAGARTVLAAFHAVADLGDVHFEYDAYHIRPADAAKLDANAQWLRSNPKHVVLIEGHCDERGTQEYNVALGEHRAKATMTYLVSQGVEPHRIRLISYGKERPMCTDESDGCWSRNRRAHFLVKTE